MKYITKLGNQYIIEDFVDEVELRLDHVQKLPYNSITKIGRDTVMIDTPLIYEVGQGVSVGGYETGGKYFRLLEISVTDYPVFPDAEIIGIAQEQQSKYELLVI